MTARAGGHLLRWVPTAALGEVLTDTILPTIPKNAARPGRWALILWLAMSLLLSACATTLERQEEVRTANQHYELGVQYLDQARYTLAISEFTRALSQLSEAEDACKRSERCEIEDPAAFKHKMAVIHTSRAYAYLKFGGQHQNVLADTRAAILLRPDLPEPYLYLGLIHLQMDNPDSVWKAYQALVPRDQRLAQELYRLYTLKYGNQ